MKHGPLRILLTLCLVVLLTSVCSFSFAETIDLSNMNYDELIALRDQTNALIKELERQYAIENGNRVITLDHENVTLFPKQTQTLIPEVKRIVEDAPETTDVVWSSSDETVATVSAKGTITAVAAGDAVITCTASDDEYIFASVPIHVGLRVEAVGLSTEELTLHLSDTDSAAATHQLSAIITPENAFCQDVTWTTSDESIATVDENGTIRAFTPGSVTIRATSNEIPAKDQKAKTRSCSVTVIRDVASITLSDSNLRIKKGGTATLKASLLPENATTKKTSWESSDSSIASITTSGQITAKANGTCTITCKATDGSEVFAVCEVTVFQPVTSITADKTSVNAFIGSAPTQIAVTISPESATDKTLTWTSSDETIATVDENGNITAVSGGSCTITCATCDGTEKTASISVLVPSISVEKTDYTVTEKSGLTIPLKYFGQDISKLTATVANKSFLTAKVENDDTPCVIIMPEKAGKTTITLNDSTNTQNAVKLNIEVASSAVYDSKSYPTASYKTIMRDPEGNTGKQYQIYGKVLQKIYYDEYNYVWMLVRVNGENYAVSYYTWDLPNNVIEDDYITVYGICTGTYSYESSGAGYLTVPEMTAEKIKIGRKN